MALTQTDRARLDVRRAGVVELLRRIAGDVARLSHDELDAILGGLQPHLDGLVDTVDGVTGHRP